MTGPTNIQSARGALLSSPASPETTGGKANLLAKVKKGGDYYVLTPLKKNGPAAIGVGGAFLAVNCGYNLSKNWDKLLPPAGDQVKLLGLLLGALGGVATSLSFGILACVMGKRGSSQDNISRNREGFGRV